MLQPAKLFSRKVIILTRVSVRQTLERRGVGLRYRIRRVSDHDFTSRAHFSLDDILMNLSAILAIFISRSVMLDLDFDILVE